MSCILHIETSTAVCSVAVSEDGQNIFVKEDLKGPSHAVSLGVFVDEALSFIDSHAIPLDAVAVSCGPGSYTGLRIGVSMAKGICYGRNVPLIGIPTLEVLSVPVLLYHELPEDALLCPMIDARRMEVYAAIYDRALNVKREISADIVDENSYLEYLEQHPVYFFGNGAAKCREKITHPNAHFIDDLHPLAKMMFPLAENFTLTPIEIGSYCRAEMQYLKEAEGKQEIDYQLDLPENDYKVYSHPQYFSLLLRALLNNANKFTTQGFINLSCRKDNKRKMLLVSITDTGCGIPAEKHEYVFRRFTKLDIFKQGSGLGLYLCKLIIKHMQGDIYIDETYTKGSRFIFTLPMEETKK